MKRTPLEYPYSVSNPLETYQKEIEFYCNQFKQSVEAFAIDTKIDISLDSYDVLVLFRVKFLCKNEVLHLVETIGDVNKNLFIYNQGDYSEVVWRKILLVRTLHNT